MQTHVAPQEARPTAVMGRRVVAWIIDFAIGAVIVGAIVFSSFDSTTAPSSDAASDFCQLVNDDTATNEICINIGDQLYLAEAGDLGPSFLVGLAYGLLNMVLLPTLTGGSIGKLLLGIRVVRQDTFEVAGFGAQLVRWLLWIVDGAFCGPLIAFIVASSSAGNRRVGDMAAKTFVVDKEWVGRPVAVPGVTGSGLGSAPTAVAGAGAAVGVGATGFPPPPDTATAPPPPVDAPPTSPPVADVAPPTEETLAPEAPGATEAPFVEPPPPPVEEPPTPAARPGIDAPQWDTDRDTYIQWDPDLGEWMEWDESGGRWIPIST